MNPSFLVWTTPLLALSLMVSACAQTDTRTSGMGGALNGDGGAPPVAGDAGTGWGDGDGGLPPVGSGLGCNKMDIVFVIDNSGSMEDEQKELAASFPGMIQVLNDFKGGALDYRVAVTTTSFPDKLDMLLGAPTLAGDQGTFLPPPGLSRPWLERTDPNVGQAFTKVATVGTDGSGQEQPLAAALDSVTKRVDDGANKGFLRSDALLAFVILTDEDDQSVPDGDTIGLGISLGDYLSVDEFISDFDKLTGDRSRWATTVIAGDSQCDSDLGGAEEATRLKDFVMKTGHNATFSSICKANFDQSLQDALNTFTTACNNYVLY